MERKEAIEVIKKNWPDSSFTMLREALETLVPELVESEDERIRKWLIYYFKEVCDNVSEKEKKGVIAWLEKQGEQKSNANCLLNWSEMDEKMLKSLEGIVKDYWAKAEQEKNEIKIREASNVSYFLKTIQKSPLCWIKCSDGLPNKDGIYLVVTDGRHNDVYDMARYDSIEGWHKASEIIYWMSIPQLNNKNIIEQNPAWSEEDEKMRAAVLQLITDSEKENGWNCVYCNDKEIYFSDIIAWFKALRPQNTWRPSYEQISVLEFVMEDIEKDYIRYAVLNSVLEQLKKLREEKI